jgi:hypothetical protein
MPNKKPRIKSSKKEIAITEELTENQLETLAIIREREARITPFRLKGDGVKIAAPEAKTQHELAVQNFCTLGVSDRECALELMHQLTMANPSLTTTNGMSLINHNSVLLAEIEPRTGLEGMLAIQMVAVHHLAIEMLGRAARQNATVEAVNSAINRATKLSRTFVAQMEALDKHRNKGKQKMTVEHIHVNQGGQAIIGSVGEGGGKE